MDHYLTSIAEDRPAPKPYEEWRELYASDRDAVLDPLSSHPFGLVPIGEVDDDAEQPDAFVFKLNPDHVDLVRVRTYAQLRDDGLFGRWRGWLTTFVPGGYYLHYWLIRRGRKATIAVDVHPPYAPVDDEQLRTNLDHLADAFPTFIGCLANSRSRVPGIPMIARVPNGDGGRGWTALIDFDVPVGMVDELPDIKLDPDRDWLSSKGAVVLLLLQGVTVEHVIRLDRAALAMAREAASYHRMGGRYAKALKTGVNRDWTALRKDPVRLTRVLLGPVRSVIGMSEEWIDDFDLGDAELGQMGEDGSALADGSDSLTSDPPNEASGGAGQIHFAGGGCDCGFNPNTCGAGAFCRWQYG